MALPCVFSQPTVILSHMFSTIKALPSALERLCTLLEALVHAVHGLIEQGSTGSDLKGRMDELERRVGLIVADAEAKLAQAEGKLKAARNAEERERRLAESAERRAAGDDEELTEEQIREAYARAGIHLGDGEPSDRDGLQPVPSHLDARREGKAQAIAAKWGRT